MGIIYAFRHGETDFNRQKKYAGKLDIPLIDDGISQARTLRNKLSDTKIDKAYCGTLLRQRQTLGIVIEPHLLRLASGMLEIVYNIRFDEREFGSVTGSFKQHISDEYPQYHSKDVRYLWNFKTKTGESFADIESKLNPLLRQVEKEARQGKAIILSTSSGPLRIIRKYFENLTQNQTLDIENLNCDIQEYKIT